MVVYGADGLTERAPAWAWPSSRRRSGPTAASAGRRTCREACASGSRCRRRTAEKSERDLGRPGENSGMKSGAARIRAAPRVVYEVSVLKWSCVCV